MTEWPAHSGERGTPALGEARRALPIAVRHVAWVPLLLVVFSLAGLAAVPVLVRQRTRQMRQELRSVAEPARLLLGELRVGLAREIALADAFALARESDTWFAYHRVAARDDSLLGRLALTMSDLSPAARASVTGVREAVERWRRIASIDLRGSRPDPSRQAAARGLDYETLLLATVRVDSVIARTMQSHRGRLERNDGLELRFMMSFVGIGCAASAGVLLLTLRGRHLHGTLKRRAEEEASLRRLAASLSGALTVNEVAELTVSAALNSSRIGGAYLARVLDGGLMTIAGRGRFAPSPGTPLPTPPWLRDGTGAEDPRLYTSEIRPAPTRAHPRHSVLHGGSLLLVPLHYHGDVVGILGMASAGGRRQFSESSLRFGRTLGDLAAVALHRAEALESEQRARSEAEAAVRTRDAVVSIVSHDLRNPLTAILGSVDFLLDERHGGQVPRTHLAALKHAADSMNRLIRDLLDVTRLEAGPLPIQRRPLRLLEVVDEVVTMFQPIVRARRLTLDRLVRHDPPEIVADRDRLAQALSNLIGNAVKFSPDGGRVTVGVDVDRTSVRVCVSDTGPGIPAEQVPYLFDRFWQASRNDMRGLGLGLSIVKAIVDAHGGTVEVESAAKQGSSFCVVLPRTDATHEYARDERSEGIADGTSSSPPVWPPVPPTSSEFGVQLE